uniref:AIG1-type G domain-containing protein n=1 Tax=Sinocyclocheilus grahami TaxID=75366 RepID=A0A672RGE7_SINGR
MLFIDFSSAFNTIIPQQLIHKLVQLGLNTSLSSIRIVLLGETGVEKSACGKTILGQKEFGSEKRQTVVTTECSEAHTTVSGRSVSVVDTPGFFDTQMSPEELMTEIARSVYLSSPGPHAFLIVFRVDRFTEQEQQIPQMIEMMFVRRGMETISHCSGVMEAQVALAVEPSTRKF